METLLELDTPSLSIYNPNYYVIAQSASVVNKEVNGIAKYWLDLLAPNATAMVEDGEAAGDTASVGVGFINAAKSVSLLVHYCFASKLHFLTKCMLA